MTKNIEQSLFYFIDKAFDYRNPNSHTHLAAAYHLKQMIEYGRDSKHFEREERLFWNTIQECGNYIPSNLKQTISEIE